MIKMSLETLADITGGALIGDDVVFSTVSTDTRQVSSDSLFIALLGKQFDAHQFAPKALAQGARSLLVQYPLPLAMSQVVVKDTRLALGQLAAWVRRQVPARVVALTGSSGKSTVKEMTAAILRQCGETLYTDGNLNNDIGVPLTLLRLTSMHRYAVVELGASQPGDIAYSVKLTRPEAVLINNIAPAHLAGFGSLAGVAKGKGEIFDGISEGGRAIINNQSHDLAQWQSALSDKSVWTFSLDPRENCDFVAKKIRVDSGASSFLMQTPEGDIAIRLPLFGQHNVANALAASALALSVGSSLSAIQSGLSSLRPIPGRLFPIRLKEGVTLLDDTYNANPDSLRAAINVLGHTSGYRILVVGDMAELGENSLEFHHSVGEVVRRMNIDKVLSFGVFSQSLSDASGVGEHFNNKDSLLERLVFLMSAQNQVTILIKGSRSAAMEQIVQALQEKEKCSFG